MVVAVLGHGEIRFHLHFEFHLKLTLYFTLNCISIWVQLKGKVVLFLKFIVLWNFMSFYFSFDLYFSQTNIYYTKYVIFC